MSVCLSQNQWWGNIHSYWQVRCAPNVLENWQKCEQCFKKQSVKEADVGAIKSKRESVHFLCYIWDWHRIRESTEVTKKRRKNKKKGSAKWITACRNSLDLKEARFQTYFNLIWSFALFCSCTVIECKHYFLFSLKIRSDTRAFTQDVA